MKHYLACQHPFHVYLKHAQTNNYVAIGNEISIQHELVGPLIATPQDKLFYDKMFDIGSLECL